MGNTMFARLWNTLREMRRKRKFERRQAWSRGLSLEETFSRIYHEARWGSAPSGVRFHSGTGSLPEFSAAYERFVIEFLDRHSEIRSIVDLGCGDFQVSDRILRGLNRSVEYIGCDIVRELIEHNQATHTRPGVRFRHCNVIDGELPTGDLALVRQVMQHLSNTDIQRIIAKIRKVYSVAIVTESLPTKLVAANVDKRGVDSRVALGSGVYLDEPPFDLPVELALDTEYSKTKFLRTCVVRFT